MFNRGIVGGAKSVEAVLTATPAPNAANQNSYTFSGQSIGDAGANRMVVVCGKVRIGNLATPSALSVTIGGVAATVIQSSTSFIASFVAYLKVPTGTTANIVVTRGGSDTPTQCAIAVYALNTTESAPVDSGTDTGASGSLSTSLSVSKGDAVIYAYINAATGASSSNWAGTESVDEAVNVTTESTRHAFGKVDIEADSTSNLTFATNGSNSASAAAVFSY